MYRHTLLAEPLRLFIGGRCRHLEASSPLPRLRCRRHSEAPAVMTMSRQPCRPLLTMTQMPVTNTGQGLSVCSRLLRQAIMIGRWSLVVQLGT